MSEVLEPQQRVKIGLHGQGCGHEIIMSPEHYKACKESGRTWYCTICGCSRCFVVGETEVQKLRRERDALLQREETLKAQRRNLEVALTKEQRSKARLKKRVQNGVCPCCTRSFTNLRRHMATKHPEHTAGKA